MKIKKILSTAFVILSLLTACNDDFMEKYPLTSLGESNAFQTYDNFKSYMYNCYGLFTDLESIRTSPVAVIIGAANGQATTIQGL